VLQAPEQLEKAERLSVWRRWLRRPQSTFLRKALFQLHLWAGITLGIYIVVVCASGSVIVFRNDVYDVLQARVKVERPPQARILNRKEFLDAAAPNFPGYSIQSFKLGRDSEEASEVMLVKQGTLWRSTMYRLADPYTGRDMGPAVSHWYRLMNWSSELHGKLFLGSQGMVVNAIGGMLLVAVCLTGMVIWWPGTGNWRRGLTVHRGTGWKRFNFDLHSAVGFWTFAILFVWGFTGAYFVFPEPVRAVVNYFTPIFPPPLAQNAQVASAAVAPTAPDAFPRPRRRRPLTFGGKILRGFSYAHYGNFAGWPIKALYVILGFAPVVLFGTALVMWWNRVLNPARKRWARGAVARTLAGH
jgi:uncharacterized iron-regulated membrane protein